MKILQLQKLPGKLLYKYQYDVWEDKNRICSRLSNKEYVAAILFKTNEGIEGKLFSLVSIKTFKYHIYPTTYALAFSFDYLVTIPQVQDSIISSHNINR